MVDTYVSSDDMKQILKNELYRAFCCKNTIFILGIGLLFVVGQMMAYRQIRIDEIQQYAELVKSGATNGMENYPSSLYECFLGGEYYTFFGELYFSLLPLLAVFSYGTSYYMDRKNGYANALITRVGMMPYLVSKVFTTMMIGGTMGVMPYCISFFLNSFIYPANCPNVMAWNSFVVERSMLSNLYYVHPFLYMLGYAVIIFLVAAIMAMASLVISIFSGNNTFIIMFPYILYTFQDALFQKIGLKKWAWKILVFQAKNSGIIVDITYVEVLFYLIVVLIAEGGFFLWKTRRIEMTSL